eukprot:GEMP01004889.1.p1 GENE.GEMP01004889.1~~GEMP01004889.1.p1  ORF type:complete len:826 (+),score=153.08 GEMP01004889.1:197-2674(+)
MEMESIAPYDTDDDVVVCGLGEAQFLTNIDQWDWKTDAPVFIPENRCDDDQEACDSDEGKLFTPVAAGATVSPILQPMVPGQDSVNGTDATTPESPMNELMRRFRDDISTPEYSAGMYEWQVNQETKPSQEWIAARDKQIGQASATNGTKDLQNLLATKDREISSLNGALSRFQIKKAQLVAQADRDRLTLETQLKEYVMVIENLKSQLSIYQQYYYNQMSQRSPQNNMPLSYIHDGSPKVMPRRNSYSENGVSSGTLSDYPPHCPMGQHDYTTAGEHFSSAPPNSAQAQFPGVPPGFHVPTNAQFDQQQSPLKTAPSMVYGKCFPGGKAGLVEGGFRHSDPTHNAGSTAPLLNGAFDGVGLDTKMKQLNQLLQNSASSAAYGNVGPCSPYFNYAVDTVARMQPDAHKGDDMPDQSVAYTLAQMFSHATVRPGPNYGVRDQGSDGAGSDSDNPLPDFAALSKREQEDFEFNKQLAQSIEDQVGPLDPRARKVLDSLAPADAREALTKLDESIRAQGGVCRNVSALLMAMCRKFTREKKQRNSDPGVPKAGQMTSEPPPGMRWTVNLPTNSEQGNASLNQIVKDALSDDEIDFSGRLCFELPDDMPAKDGWSIARLHKLAKQGCFEAKERHRCLEIRLFFTGPHNPPLTLDGMLIVCTWLQRKLKKIRKERNTKNTRGLTKCKAYVDFRNCNLTDEMLWRLLQTLIGQEVQVVSCHLSKNKIARGGIRTICEFLRKMETICELRLEENAIDVGSALDLIRTISELPRLPPARSTSAPVWVRLDNNPMCISTFKTRVKELTGVNCGQDRSCPNLHITFPNTNVNVGF